MASHTEYEHAYEEWRPNSDATVPELIDGREADGWNYYDTIESGGVANILVFRRPKRGRN